MAVSVLCLFLMVSWVGLQCIIVALPGHTHFYFVMSCCHVAVGALCLFLMVQWAGLCFVIVAFPDPEPPCEEGLKICP